MAKTPHTLNPARSSLIMQSARMTRIHRAASRRFTRHQDNGVTVREAWDRYDRVMDFAFDFLAAKGA